MNSKEFRKELVKIMPGYAWTVHRNTCLLSATGILSAGFNRLSTVAVDRFESTKHTISYEVRSSGYGKRSPWLSSHRAPTLARALRGLQDYYKAMAKTYIGHADSLEFARKKF